MNNEFKQLEQEALKYDNVKDFVAANDKVKGVIIKVGIKKGKNITYRGQLNAQDEYSSNDIRTASYGYGLYSTKDVTQARNYGKVHTVIGGIPENPLRFRNYPEVETWILREMESLGITRRSEFNEKYPDTGKYIKLKGYDGIKIGFGKDAEYYNRL